MTINIEDVSETENMGINKYVGQTSLAILLDVRQSAPQRSRHPIVGDTVLATWDIRPKNWWFSEDECPT